MAEIATEPVELHLPSRLLGSEVGLVEHQQFGDVAGLDLAEHRVHGVDLLRIGRAGVDHMDEQIGLGHHLQGALEGLDEAVGQTADESDRVGHEDGLTTREREAARRRVEGGEETVFDQDTGGRQPVQQRRLAGVRVAHDGHVAQATPLRLRRWSCRLRWRSARSR